MKLATNDEGGTWRAVYTISIKDSTCVVQAFQKKSKSGIATPKPEMDLIRQRFKQLRSEGEECRKEKLLKWNPVRAMSSRTSACPTPANT
jgi:phage-related protein